MWFKKVIFYKLNSPIKTLSELDLRKNKHQPIGRQNNTNSGWVSPLGKKGDKLSYQVKNITLLSMRFDKKQIPSSAVKEALQERVEAIEASEGRKVFGKERAAIKDDILSLMRPTALSKSDYVNGYIDERENILVIGATASMADEFIELLIDTLGELGVSKLLPDRSPSLTMDQWVMDKPPEGLLLTGDIKLEDPKEGRAVTIKDVCNYEQEILSEGYLTVRLGINYRDHFSGKINSALQLSSIQYNSELIAESDEEESPAARLEADALLMGKVFAEFYQELCSWFGINKSKE